MHKAIGMAVHITALVIRLSWSGDHFIIIMQSNEPMKYFSTVYFERNQGAEGRFYQF
jgi:hypothetical protein